MKNCSAIFEDTTVYGSREGAYPCLLVTAADKNNIYHKSRAWKHAVVKGISMLPRGEMLKVDKVDSFFAANDRFTPVQELKQVGVFLPKAIWCVLFPHLATEPNNHM